MILLAMEVTLESGLLFFEDGPYKENEMRIKSLVHTLIHYICNSIIKYFSSHPVIPPYCELIKSVFQ